MPAHGSRRESVDSRERADAERHAEFMRVVRYLANAGYRFTDRHDDSAYAEGHKFRAEAERYAKGGGR